MKEQIEVKGRASGKTFRALLTGLEKASSGETVLYFSNHGHLPSWYFDRAKDIVNAYTGMNRIKIRPNERKIEFSSGGSISFTTFNKEKLAGLHYIGIEDD